MPDAIDRWILRLIRTAYQMGYNDAQEGKGPSTFYSRTGPYDDDETPDDNDQEHQLLAELNKLP